MNTEKILSNIREEELIKYTQELIRIQSFTGQEKDLATYIKIEMERLGLEVSADETLTNRPNLICKAKGRREGIGIIFSGHMDTVPADPKQWTVDPFEGVIKNGWLYGRGSTDMKGGLAAMMIAAKAVVTSNIKLRKGFTLVFTVGDEASSEGARELYKHKKDAIKGDFVVNPEPTDLAIQGWFKGHIWYEIALKGKVAHTSTPELGINAISNLCEIITKINNEGFKHQPHEFTGNCTQVIGFIEGGKLENGRVVFVPDQCSAVFDVRSVPGQIKEGIKEELETYIADQQILASGLEGNVRIIYGDDAIETMPPNHPNLSIIQDASREAIGSKLPLGKLKIGAGDLRWFKYMGIDGVAFGPGSMDYAHKADERVMIENLLKAAKVNTMLILKRCCL